VAVRYERSALNVFVYWVFAAYVLAKLFELLDEPLLAVGHLVSGHTLKHIAAAVGGYMVCRMLLRRRALAEADPATVAI